MSETQPKTATRTTNEPRGWRKSTYSDHGAACVEVDTDSDPVLIRDSKYHGDENRRPVIAVSVHTWPAFLTAVLGEPKSGTTSEMPTITHNELTDETSLTDATGAMLTYTRAEWDAFLKAVREGQFSLPTPTSV